jgi:hypothetical protein
MDHSGCPSNLWFYAMCYVIFCLNHTVDLNLCDGKKTSYTLACGLVSDISPLLAFYFYQPVYFHLDSANQTHGHVLTRKLTFLISIAKQVLERKTMSFRFDITNSRFSRTDFTMRQILPERKYLVADVPTYQLKVHSIMGILHACCLNPKYECSILEILSATPLLTLGTLITLNPSAQPPLSSIFAMMGSILIPTVLRHLLRLNLRSRSKTKTETLDYILKVIPSQL